MRLKWGIARAVAVTALFAGTASVASAASASPAASRGLAAGRDLAVAVSHQVTRSSSTDMAKGTVISLPTGKTVKLPRNWSQLTVADMARLGLHPNMRPSRKLMARLGIKGSAQRQTVSDSAARTSGTMRPDSASGCNKSVCIYLTGSGWVVDNWSTQGYNGTADPFCTYSVYWLGKNTIYTTGAEVCGGTGYYYGTLSHGIATGRNVYACNTWISIAGKPCEYIHN